MNEGQKPFACENKGCEMTFTNEDHLNCHRKKHDMVLNIGLANKNSDVADQTPTPTRFIRNCEEVGLFQDLQNVNLFDEFFKKAMEITKAGGTLEVQEANTEDTLHTPHILPHIEESQHNKNVNDPINEDDNSHSNDFTLNNVISITPTVDDKDEQVNEPIVEIHEVPKETGGSRKIPVNNTEINLQGEALTTIKDVKLRIKQTLQVRGKHKIASNDANTNFNNSTQKIMTQVNQSVNLVSKEKIRAMNRAAQVRCRKRKAQKWKEMQDELDFLRNENKKLKTENKIIKKELMLFKHSSSNAENQNSTTEGAAEINIQPGNCSNTNSIIIKILPTDATLPAVPIGVLTQQTVTSENISVRDKEQVMKGRNLRKLIPKIVIDKC